MRTKSNNLVTLSPEKKYRNDRRSGYYIRLYRLGHVALGTELTKNFRYKIGDEISFIYDKDKNQFYITRADKDQPGFRLYINKSDKSKQLMFCNRALTTMIIDRLKLPEPKSDYTSYFFTIDPLRPRRDRNRELYQLTFKNS